MKQTERLVTVTTFPVLLSNMQRIFIIVASIIFLLGIGVGVYFLFLSNDAELTGREGVEFGSAGDAPLNQDGPGVVDGPIQAGEEFADGLLRITEGPVALGMLAYTLPSQAETASGTPAVPGDTEIRYIDRASGNIYAYRAHERTLSRISNRTLPGIQEAAWLSDGSLAFARFLAVAEGDTEYVATYALPSVGEGGYFLDRGLGQVSISGTSTLFTLLPSTSGSVATVARPDGSEARTLFSSTLSNLIVHLSDGPFIAATKPSVNLDGYAFTVGAGGVFTRILGPYRGLSVLPSPSGNLVLFSYIDNKSVKLALLDRRDGDVTALPIATFAEKCVWESGETHFFCGVPQSASGNLPDDWHQGAVVFKDRLWRVNVSARLAEYLINPSTASGIDIDMIGLSIDPRSDVLVFKNRTDGSLWMYDI